MDTGLGASALASVDWTAWFHAPGDLCQPLALDGSLAARAEALAGAWLAGTPPATDDFREWTNDERVHFLDALGANGDDGASQTALDAAALDAVDARYALTATANSEIRSRWCKLLLAAGSPRGPPLAVDFLTSQGRMKFVRPLYRALHASNAPGAAPLAVATFRRHASFYHPICRKMVASDLGVDLDDAAAAARSAPPASTLLLLAAVGAAVALAALKWRKRA